MKRMSTVLAACGAAIAVECARGQCEWASGFVPSPFRQGMFNQLKGMAVAGDGGSPALFVAGDGFGLARVARWDGRTWEAVGPELSGTILGLRTAREYEGARVYLWGTCSSGCANGVPRLGRWRQGTWEAMNASFLLNGAVRDIAVADVSGNGTRSLYVLGRVSATEARLGRWNGTGFDIIWTGSHGDVWAIEGYDHDGSGREPLYMSGRLTFDTAPWELARFDGQAWEGVARFQAVVQPWVNRLEIMQGPGDPAPALYATGLFTGVNGLPAKGIARFDGTEWSTPAPPYSGVGDVLVNLERPEARGLYTMFWQSGTPPLPTLRGLARFGEDPATGLLGWSVVSAINNQPTLAAAFDDGPGHGEVLYAGGGSSLFNWGGKYIQRMARWTGTEWGGWGSVGNAVSGPVRSLMVYERRQSQGDPGGTRIFATGDFEFAGDRSAGRSGEWDGAAWQVLAPANNSIFASAWAEEPPVGPGLYFAGAFTSLAGLTHNRIARYTPVSYGYTLESMGSGMNDVVYALAVFDDGSGPGLYAGGWFTQAGGQSVSHIARWDGQNWSDVGGGTNLAVRSLVVYAPSGGAAGLYAGGHFRYAGGVLVDHIARWDGTSWSSVGGGVSSPGGFSRIYTLAVSEDDPQGPALYAGGEFTHAGGAGGVTANNIARWNGEAWSGLGGGTSGRVRAIQAHNDSLAAAPGASRMYIGGEFTAVGNPAVAVRHLAVWDPAGELWSEGAAGTDGPVLALASVDFNPGGNDGRQLIVGGEFTSVGARDLPSHYFAVLNCASGLVSCYANCDGSVTPPILNVDDFTCFINDFAAAQGLPHAQQVGHYANCDQSTVAPVLNVDDFTCFINAFAAGCP